VTKRLEANWPLFNASKVVWSKFEIVSLLSVVERSISYVFNGDGTPHSPWGRGLYVMEFACCLRIVFVIGKYTDNFGGGGLWLGLVSIEGTFLGEENFGGWIFKRKFYTGDIWLNSFSKFLLIVLHYLCQLNFAHEAVPGKLSAAVFCVFWFSGKN
jgi:hypothetical protein